jgi:hypothetical protein
MGKQTCDCRIGVKGCRGGGIDLAQGGHFLHTVLATRFAELTGGKEGCSIFFNEGHQQSSIATCLYKDFF